MPSSVTADAIFSGITTFARLPWVQCLTRERNIPFDIAFIGVPFVSLLFRNMNFLPADIYRILAPVTDQVLDLVQVCIGNILSA